MFKYKHNEYKCLLYIFILKFLKNKIKILNFGNINKIYFH